MKHLVLGATGNIGGRVAQRLINGGGRPSVFVRDAKRAQAQFGDQVDIHVGDLDHPGPSLDAAMADVESIFLISDGPDLDKQDRAVSEAARRSNVRQVVKLSTLDVETGVGTGAWHARGEAAIADSGLAFTFIRAAGFMSNALSWAAALRRSGVLHSSTGAGKIAFIHPEDIAAVSAACLTSRVYDGQALVITGPEPLSYAQMVETIGAAIGRPFGYKVISDAEAFENTAAWAGDTAYAAALVDIWRAVREGILETVTDGVKQVTGEEPISFGQWAVQNSAWFR